MPVPLLPYCEYQFYYFINNIVTDGSLPLNSSNFRIFPLYYNTPYCVLYINIRDENSQVRSSKANTLEAVHNTKFQVGTSFYPT